MVCPCFSTTSFMDCIASFCSSITCCADLARSSIAWCADLACSSIACCADLACSCAANCPWVSFPRMNYHDVKLAYSPDRCQRKTNTKVRESSKSLTQIPNSLWKLSRSPTTALIVFITEIICSGRPCINGILYAFRWGRCCSTDSPI